MQYSRSLLALAALLAQAAASPIQACLANSSCGPIPGESSVYSKYDHIEAPFPGNTTGAVLNTTSGPPGPDDLLFQNLLAAEWIIFSFYQQGVEAFDKWSFVDAGFPVDTYDRIREIRNNEAGHLRIFQNQISSNSIKPGPCRYQYPFYNAESFLALQTVIEVSSMAFLTGLELQAQTNLTKGALVAIASTETRHNVWTLMSNWNVDPFAGPADTYFPYANLVLQFTATWVVPGSCPKENQEYPLPSQKLIPIGVDQNKTSSLAPGSEVVFEVGDASWNASTEYYAVFFHGVLNITQPFNTANLSTIVPPQLEEKGIFSVVIATEKGAPTTESVVAGPVILLQSPARVGLQES